MIKRKKENSFSEKAIQEFLPIVKAAISPIVIGINSISAILNNIQLKISSANNVINWFSNAFNLNWSDPIPNLNLLGWQNFISSLGFNVNPLTGFISFNNPFDFDSAIRRDRETASYNDMRAMWSDARDASRNRKNRSFNMRVIIIALILVLIFFFIIDFDFSIFRRK